MVWVAVLTVVLLSCFAVVGTLGWRTFQRVRALGRTVAAASERIAEASAALEEIAPTARD